ncbi:unnamed protein product [Strongylus vulgaris]|uniref:Uncharacterized protein n=1 Tax=Strongylus vulgaris TaxID=40348 RepID=A0A3P7ISC3_STRVU|nr:unnamed protein product [Strongylus vulgaris]
MNVLPMDTLEFPAKTRRNFGAGSMVGITVWQVVGNGFEKEDVVSKNDEPDALVLLAGIPMESRIPANRSRLG